MDAASALGVDAKELAVVAAPTSTPLVVVGGRSVGVCDCGHEPGRCGLAATSNRRRSRGR